MDIVYEGLFNRRTPITIYYKIFNDKYKNNIPAIGDTVNNVPIYSRYANYNGSAIKYDNPKDIIEDCFTKSQYDQDFQEYILTNSEAKRKITIYKVEGNPSYDNFGKPGIYLSSAKIVSIEYSGTIEKALSKYNIKYSIKSNRVSSKALESFLIPTTEGLFDRFKNKTIYPTSSQSIIKDVSKEKADPRFLIGASNKSYHGYIPYSNKSIIGNYFHYYEDINPAVNKAGQKIKTIAKSKKALWDQTPKGIEAFLNTVFDVFSNSKEWKMICDIQNMISVIDSSIYDPNFKSINDNLYELSDDEKIMPDTINEWKFIHKTEFLDCIIYDYDLISCSQDQFFRADDIISYLLDCAVSIFDNVTANCFTDDIEVFSVVIHK